LDAQPADSRSALADSLLSNCTQSGKLAGSERAATCSAGARAVCYIIEYACLQPDCAFVAAAGHCCAVAKQTKGGQGNCTALAAAVKHPLA
jgi:hypothetical protein